MQTITTTELRTRSKELVKVLNEGQSVELIHRSRVVGEIKPKTFKEKPLTQEDIKQLQKLAEEMHLPKLSYKERDRIYRKHLMEKYGKGLS